MKIKRIFLFILAFSPLIGAGAQDPQILTLSLDEAQSYAIEYNKTLKAARLDIKAAEMAKWDAISNGLPRVDGSGSLNDNLKLMTTLLPGEIIGQPPGTYIPVQFGQKYNTGYGVQVSQLLFNANYIVGVQMAGVVEKLNNQVLEKTELDIRESVISTYYIILVSEESLGIINDNIETINSMMKSTEAMYSVGMAEVTDVDQMKSNLSMVENSKRSIERNIEFTRNLLRFQLGLDVESEIILSTTLDDLLAEADFLELLNINLNYQTNIDYILLETQEEMSGLTLKGEKSAVLPSISGFYSWNKNGMGNKLNELQWFPNSMLGFQMNVPIFASGQRYSKIRRAQYDLEKAATAKSQVTDNLLLQEKQLRFNLASAKEQYESQLENLDVAKRVYESVNNKYREGMASSLDVTQAQNIMLTAESNYETSVLNLLQTKLALQKLLNIF